MKDFLTLAKERCSVRKFEDREIEQEKLDYILACGQVAPSARNLQPFHTYLLLGKDAVKRMEGATHYTFSAPAMLIVTYDQTQAWVRDKIDDFCSGQTDAAILASHYMFAACDCGLGTTWVQYFDPKEVKKELNLPENIQVMTLLPLGYPAADYEASPRHTERKDLCETLTIIR